MLLTAGRHAEAVAPLRLAVAECGATESPRPWVRAALLLGKALEANGDTRGACDAYAKILVRWGTAKRSVTADEARAHSKKLGCAAH